MSTLLPGVQVVPAPRFHIDGAWSERLSINSGTVIDDGHLYPRTNWRSPTQAELDLLTTESASSGELILLFSIPDHLQAQWWSLASESVGEAGLEGETFKKFANDILDYLLFKKMPLPPECRFEVILTAPGQPSARVNAVGLLGDLAASALLGGINLSDEDAYVIFLNLCDIPVSDPNSAVIEERQRAFLLENCDYPLTRLKLRPREGYWLPRRSIIIDRDTLGRSEIDVHLAIKQSP